MIGDNKEGEGIWTEESIQRKASSKIISRKGDFNLTLLQYLDNT